MIKKIICAITLLSFSSDILTMFTLSYRCELHRSSRLGELAEIMAEQLIAQPVIEQQLQTSNKKIDFNVYKKQKKYPLHPLDKIGTSKHTKNRKDRKRN